MEGKIPLLARVHERSEGGMGCSGSETMSFPTTLNTTEECSPGVKPKTGQLTAGSGGSVSNFTFTGGTLTAFFV